MMRNQLKLLFVFVLFLNWNSSDAQYQYHAAIKPVDTSGFYAIDITPELSSYVSVSFNDIRIVNKDAREVPYFVRAKWANNFMLDYRYLKILSINSSDSNQSVVLENTSNDKIEEIGLLLKNAAVSRMINISGSNDNIKWFAIVENLALVNNYLPSKDEFVEEIPIPLSSYRYLRVVINNKKNDPLNILKAGYNHPSEYKIAPEYTDNGSSFFIQRDSSDNNSYIFITHNEPYHFDKLDISVKAPKYYKRNAEVVIDGLVYSYVISSDTLIHFSFPSSKAQKYYVRIYNGDNPPIKIVDIHSGQLKKQITAWLEKNIFYELLLGSPKAESPKYDLANFKDSISVILPIIETDKIVPYPVAKQKSDRFDTKDLVWPAIIAALLILGLLTFRLTNEVEKK